MKEALVNRLRCVDCTVGGLSLSAQRRDGDEVETGVLSCGRCGKDYRIVRGVPRMVEADAYACSFSFEWQLHRRTQIDTGESDKSARVFRRKTGLRLEDLAGKRVLDVGVGAGRFAEVVSRWGAEVVGIDLSLAVETAMENVGHRPNANIVQADLFNLPFETESFDIIYSIGVLHHTPECQKAFLSLIPYLRPGGTIAIWVYDGHNWSPGSLLETANRFWRSISTRLPHPILYTLCICELPFYFLRKIPGADLLMHLVLPGLLYHAIPRTNNHPRIKEHILDTFDWYSPKYQSKHTYPELFAWFEQCGLEQIRVLPHPVSMSGRKRVTKG